MRTTRRIIVAATVLAGSMAVAATATWAEDGEDRQAGYRHALLISIDGMHAVDLRNYISAHPQSHLAGLAAHGVIYPKALASAPSDSFPGLLALVTGGTPKSTGVFYDNSYDRELFAPGSNCQGSPGTQALFDESIDNDPASFTGGGTLGQPLTQINASRLPLALVNGACVPVYPHQFIKVNTIFEVIRAHGGRTAWSDKHPAYDLVNGPSGKGVQDLFTPEVNSNDSITGQDTTKGFNSVQRNDMLKVKSVLNEIAGFDSTGASKVGVPTIFGMNFQAVSVGQKLAKGNKNDPLDAGLVGGYADPAGAKPNNGLQSGLDFVDAQIGAVVSALQVAGLERSTLVIITAKHGQSPINVALRQAVDDGPYGNTPGVAQVTTDDVGLVWLAPAQQKTAYSAAKAYLKSQADQLGIAQLLDKDELANLFGNPFGNNRTPDFVALVDHGVIYTGGTKLAEHGGFANDDRNVALLVSNPKLSPKVVNDEVETRQVAPTILCGLSINPSELDSVREEATKALPGLQQPE
jgi:predicted AlkP superfamily pyrophosphatase or phosphodiesterase